MTREQLQALRQNTTKRISKAIEEGNYKATFNVAVEDSNRKIITIYYTINGIDLQQRYTDVNMYDRDITRLGRQHGLTGEINSQDLWDKEVSVMVKHNGDFTNVYPYSPNTTTTAEDQPF
jgi:hypothetical protein